MSLAFLALAACFLAYSNGANDNFKGVATLFGSGTAGYRTAISWATVPARRTSGRAWSAPPAPMPTTRPQKAPCNEIE